MFFYIYCSFIFIILITSFVKPNYGLCLYVLCFLFLNPTDFRFEAIDKYRIALVLALLIFFLNFIKGFHIGQLKFTVPFFLLFCCIALGYYLYGNVQEQNTKYLYSFLKALVFSSLLVWSIKERKTLVSFLNFVVTGAACNGAVCIYEQFYPFASRMVADVNVYDAAYRSRGISGEPNECAGMMVAAVPLAYYLYKNTQHKFLRLLYLAGMLLIIGGVVCTLSRTGLVCLGVVTLGIFIKNIKNIVTIVVVLAVLAFALNFAKDAYKSRGTMETSLSGKVSTDSSTSTRFALQSAAIQLWMREPIFGIGLLNFKKMAFTKLGMVFHVGAIHNSYLHMLCEFGIMGLGLFLYILFSAWKAAAQLKEHGGPFYSELAGYIQLTLLSWYLFSLAFQFEFTASFWMYLSLPFIAKNIFDFEKPPEISRC